MKKSWVQVIFEYTEHITADVRATDKVDCKVGDSSRVKVTKVLGRIGEFSLGQRLRWRRRKRVRGGFRSLTPTTATRTFCRRIG